MAHNSRGAHNSRVALNSRVAHSSRIGSRVAHGSRTAPYNRYLRLLGFAASPTGLDGLRDIVRRHLCLVPFENVSKLLLFEREGCGRMPELSEFLDGIEHHDLGGTCYTNNPFLRRLLTALGYDADLLGADMSTPNIHTSVRVRLDGAAYHVDVGFASPFYEPIRLDRLPHEIPAGEWRYVFDRSGEGHEMSVFCGAERRHGYLVHEPPRAHEFFAPAIIESYGPAKTFMTQLRISRFFEDHAIELRDRNVMYYRGAQTARRTLSSMAELKQALAGEFGMPRCPVESAVQILERITGRRFFAAVAEGRSW